MDALSELGTDGIIRIEAAPQDDAQALRIRMRDGIHLASDLYLPDGPRTGLPTVLIRLPYDKCGRYTFVPAVARAFASQGFAVLAQDVRGKFRSEGAREPYVHEADDGWDTLEWIVAQPWSNGAVGTWGDSYYGFTQWALASRGHPAHRAMVPRVTGSRLYDRRPGGGMPTLTLLGWLANVWDGPGLSFGATLDPLAVPAIDMVDESLPHGGAVFRRYLADRSAPEGVERLVYPEGPPAARLRIPALHVGGWFDNIQYWQLDDWAEVQSAPAREHQFLRMTTGDHEDYPWREPGEPIADDIASSDGALARYLAGALADPLSFFDHYLRGAEGVWRAPRVSFDVVRGGVRASASWPPAGVETVHWPLVADAAGLRLGGVPGEGGAARWVHDPDDPVPCPIPVEYGQNRDGLPDESFLADRDDALVFAGARLERALELLGPVSARLAVRFDAPSTQLVVRLLDVHPDGSMRLVLGNGVELARDEGEVLVRLGDTAYLVPQGHRLALAITSSFAGRYPVHRGGPDAWAGGSGGRVVHELDVGRGGSFLTLTTATPASIL